MGKMFCKKDIFTKSLDLDVSTQEARLQLQMEIFPLQPFKQINISGKKRTVLDFV